MRHDVERYRMLLENETNPRARKVLTRMIEELESRVPETVGSEVEAPSVIAAAPPAKVPAHFFPL
jgi:hypothetical protein